MALSGNESGAGALKTAGWAPPVYSLLVVSQSDQVSLVWPTMRNTRVGPGEDSFIPKVNRRTPRPIFVKTSTDGVTFTRTTDNSGNEITPDVIDAVAAQLHEESQYLGAMYPKDAWNRLPVNRRQAVLTAQAEADGRALARIKDKAVLALAISGLVPSANRLQAGAPANFSSTTLDAIMTRCHAAFMSAGTTVHVWLPPGQRQHVRAVNDIWEYSKTGRPVGLNAPEDAFFYGNVVFHFHNDVRTSAGVAYCLFYDEQAMGGEDVAMDVDDVYLAQYKSYLVSPDIDFKYGILDNERVGYIEVPA